MGTEAVRNQIRAELISQYEGRIKELEAGYTEAIEDIMDWAEYASPYFREKHDAYGCVTRHQLRLKAAIGEQE